MIIMNDTLQGFLAAIGGFSVGKLFDYLNLNKSHSLALKKEYFLNKLNAFEKATTYYTITHTSITTIAAVFNTLNNEDVDFPPEVVESMLKKVAENLEFVQKSTQDSALALGLYTDLKFADENELLFTRYLEILGQISLTTQVIRLLNEGEVGSSNEEVNRLDSLVNEKIKEIGQSVSELVAISSKVKILHTGITDHLRSEMKKFEY